MLLVVESMFMQDLDGVFDKMIDTVYKETSRHLLHVLHTKYKFMEHLKVNISYVIHTSHFNGHFSGKPGLADSP